MPPDTMVPLFSRQRLFTGILIFKARSVLFGGNLITLLCVLISARRIRAIVKLNKLFNYTNTSYAECRKYIYLNDDQVITWSTENGKLI